MSLPRKSSSLVNRLLAKRGASLQIVVVSQKGLEAGEPLESSDLENLRWERLPARNGVVFTIQADA